MTRRPSIASLASLSAILLLLTNNRLVTVSLGGSMLVTLCVLMWERKHSNPFLARIAEKFLLLEFTAIAICCVIRFIALI